MPTSPRLISTLRWTHRWIGLTLGLLLTLIAVSGSLLLFQAQFFRWAHGELIPDNLPQQMGSIDQWVTNARAAVPNLHGPVAIWHPHTEHNVSDAGMLVFAGAAPSGLGQLGLVAVLVAPTSGDVLGVVNVDTSPAYAPLFLHGQLWAGSTGQVLLGITALASLALFAIGLYLWWPPRGSMLKKLSVRPLRSTLTSAMRLHDSIAVWTLVFLFVLVATGLYMVQPGWVEPALHLLPGPTAHSMPATSPAQCNGPIGFDTAIARASVLVPDAVPRAIHPEDEAALRPWELVFTPKDSHGAPRETHVVVNLDCGTLAVETPKERPVRDSTELWLSSLHDGTAFGLFGEIFVTVLGLAPLVLAWTGMKVWLRRRRGRAQRKSNVMSTPASSPPV